MSKWERIKVQDVIEGDYIRHVVETERSRIVTESYVGSVDKDDDSIFLEATGAWVYASDINVGDDEKLYRKRKPFVWPNKLGAIVSYEENGETVLCVLVGLDADTEDPYHEFYHPAYGSCNKADLEGYKNLKVVFEGVDVEKGN